MSGLRLGTLVVVAALVAVATLLVVHLALAPRTAGPGGPGAPGGHGAGEVALRDLFTLPYGSGAAQIGYIHYHEIGGGVQTVRAWCVSPRRTLWFVDEVSGLAKEFSVDGRLLRSLPVLARAWKRALARDAALRKQLVGPRDVVPTDLTLPDASSAAEDASGRLLVTSPSGEALGLVLDAKGDPMVERRDEQGKVLAWSGWEHIRNAIRRRAKELGWREQPWPEAVWNDTRGNVYVKVIYAVGREGEADSASVRLKRDLSVGEFVPAELLGENGVALRWRYPHPVVEVLTDGRHVDRTVTLRLPAQVLGMPASTWLDSSAGGWATADRQGRIVTTAGGVSEALIVYDGRTGAGITWAKIPADERRTGDGRPGPALDPKGGVFVACFKDDGLHVLHLDL